MSGRRTQAVQSMLTWRTLSLVVSSAHSTVTRQAATGSVRSVRPSSCLCVRPSATSHWSHRSILNASSQPQPPQANILPGGGDSEHRPLVSRWSPYSLLWRSSWPGCRRRTGYWQLATGEVARTRERREHAQWQSALPLLLLLLRLLL